MPFHRWLRAQRTRRDDVGAFARYAANDRAFPRHTNNLHVFLLRYEGMPAQRRAVKHAHRAWRKSIQQDVR